jgi:GH43 family beta-xylosidase
MMGETGYEESRRLSEPRKRWRRRDGEEVSTNFWLKLVSTPVFGHWFILQTTKR